MSKEKEQTAPLFRTRAAVDSATYNETEHTVEVTFATDSRVWMGGYYETLSCAPDHVRLARLNSGANVLDNHNRHASIKDGGVLGVVENARIENGKGYAKLRFSTRSDLEGFRHDVKTGIIGNVSAGYRVYKYQQLNSPGDGPDEMLAVDWEPMEISFVPVPGDYNAKVRSANDELPQIEIINNPNLNLNLTRSLMETPEVVVTPTAPAPAPVAEQSRAAVIDAAAIATNAANAAIVAERKRSNDIYDAVRAAGLTDEFGRELVANGTPLDAARAAIIAEFAKGDIRTRASHVAVTGTDVIDKERAAIEGAILHRAAPSDFKLEGQATDFRGFSLVDAARHAVESKGESVRGLTSMEIATRALSTSDFPALLANVTNKFLRKSYSEAEQTWRPLANQMSATDFKAITGVQFGGSIKLEEVGENGEFKAAKLKESAESFSLKTYGKIISITRQAIINDDLNGFTRASKLFGQAAANLESDLMWGKIIGNAKMSDGKGIFHADHKNLLTGAGSALNEAGLSAARVKLMRQTGLDSEVLNLTPRYLIVAPELLTTAQKLMSSIVANATSDVNVFAGSLQIVCDQRLTNPTEWYVACSPSQIDGLVYAYLNGNAGVYTETQTGFDVDAVKIKARLDFGSGVFDYRGFLKNTGV